MIDTPEKIFELPSKRIIGSVSGALPGPTLIFVGGIHGNEPSGVYALQKVMLELADQKDELKGTVVALAGNISALQKGMRYLNYDLNRLFTKENISNLHSDLCEFERECEEQQELCDAIDKILTERPGPFYFFDLHTTSGETVPFLTVNDSLLNRRFTKQYPAPIVLGIEEYLDGPLLSYINELGYVAFGFEAGQHTSKQSIQNHIAFIMLSLVFTGVLSKEDANYEQHYQMLHRSTIDKKKFYEIIFRYRIDGTHIFKMNPGYTNFQRIQKHDSLAVYGEKVLKAPYSGRIFMPLYQGKGEDGFFVIREIPVFFLWLSKWFRSRSLDRFLVLLPGVRWGEPKGEVLLVNKTIALFLAKQLFHLLGYRSKKVGASHYIMKNREKASRTLEYVFESWF